MTTPLSTNAKSYLDFSGLAELRAQASRDEAGAAKEAARQFEAYFLQEMMKSMRASVEKSDLFDSTHTDTYQDMMDKEVAQKIAASGGVGLADMLTRQFSQQPMAAQDALSQRSLSGLSPGAPSGLPVGQATKAWPLAADRLNRSLK